ncbi:hypothetical protein TMEN_5849 [Trichophyton mentagrophytes]|uniref:Ubiquitin-conjugating enzyme E2C-binding protein n=1 Tax=Trichophyton interdigitale (strain MR816) TaxID=1215338 RepID=A0A059J6M5_TRIIM|nr:hypothetical protein H101_04040 [Trichophyton interdigitale H6]KDB23323.1 hypothetical protein H109_04781 [Trichophyton interdigitale MR816]GBF63227.1 hypothetical protein TMEN_5849 [Trichophyton mentagrophytes]
MASSSPSEPCVQLYAELLANIRQIRLYVTTKDAVRNDSRPVVTLDSSRSLVTVSHSDRTLTLKLPLSVSARAREHLAASQATSHGGENEYSFRLPIDEAGSAVGVAPCHDYTSMSPWPAKSMTAQTCICCRGCANILFSPGEAQNIVWKDLPSADWAEMMDLWHCHKPDPIPSRDRDMDSTSLDGNTKGYGASNRVVCKPGTVFVNITSFIMTQGDCQGAKITNAKGDSSFDQGINSFSPPSVPNLCCKSCGSAVGEVQNSLQGVELFKASVSISHQANCTAGTCMDKNLLENYPPELIIGFQLLEAVERSGTRRFAIHCGSEDNQQHNGLLAWVFNTDLRYSFKDTSSASCSVSARCAMKVFYKHVANVQPLVNPDLGMPSVTSLEELRLPLHIYHCIKSVLEKSTSQLPPSGRKFGEWEIGLLDLESA